MPGSTAPPANASKPQLQACINLVKQVSYRARNKEFKNRGPGDILARMNDNGWHTWWYSSTVGGTPTACAFFQYIRSRQISAGVYNYAMCIGFDTTAFPMNSDADCQTFLQTVVGGTAGDGLLWDCVKNVLNVTQVYCVDAPDVAVAAFQNAQRNRLFTYMQQHSPGPNWKMTRETNNTTAINSIWGGCATLWILYPT